MANKLFPMASISKKIEDFANEKLNSVLEVIPSGDSATTEMAPEAHKVCLTLSLLSYVVVLIFFSDLGVLAFSEGYWFRKLNSFSCRRTESDVSILCIVHQGQ